MIVYILLGIVVVQDILHRVERRDLYNRIMSKSLPEYKQSKTPPKTPKPAHKRVLDKWHDKGVDVK